MVETPQSIFDEHGAVGAAGAGRARASGRMTAAHFGTYDYTASLGITAAHQHMRHPVCDFARSVMQVALAGTDVWLSDGATNVLPVAIRVGRRARASAANRAAAIGWKHALRRHPPLADQRRSTRAGTCIRRSSSRATRRSTRSSSRASTRRRNGCAISSRKAAQATLVGEVFDDAATGQGLLNFFLRALNCGAVQERRDRRADRPDSRGVALWVVREDRAGADLNGASELVRAGL